MAIDRRGFLGGAGLLGLALARLGHARPPGAPLAEDVFGPIVPDPAGILDLPEGYEYTLLSRVGETMDDGLLVPGLHDGMACFPGTDGATVLVRNHELTFGRRGAFGGRHELLGNLPADRVYDAGTDKGPCLGATTTLVFDTERQALVSHHLSLAGTMRNCAGGPTPWGSWITCEEDVSTRGGPCSRDHGWAFEVPAAAEGLVEPVPLRAMGRFRREAVAVHERSGVVYQTEDDDIGLFYRFVPDEPGDLRAGGELEALRVRGAPALDTRNWHRFGQFPVGEPVEVEWTRLKEPEAPENDLRHRGFLRGAARFARGEGAWASGDEIWFACTTGGRARAGQLWRYVPSPMEGTGKERRERATLELVFESSHKRLVDMCDNITVTPWGDLILCEDGSGEDRLLCLTERGDLLPLARNAANDSELAGACFSPDGTTLFVNVQSSGVTAAITGPWPGRSGR